jgi:hypothetical protein
VFAAVSVFDLTASPWRSRQRSSPSIMSSRRPLPQWAPHWAGVERPKAITRIVVDSASLGWHDGCRSVTFHAALPTLAVLVDPKIPETVTVYGCAKRE